MLHRIRRRYEATVSALLEDPVQPAFALREALRSGYDGAALRADLMAGIVVGIVALPLSMALAIASGVPPQHGLYTAIIAGFIAALLGGSRTQVSGPTAAFVVLLAPVSHHYGLSGLLVASMIAGIILVILGLAKAGRFIEFIPFPVTTGFTAGIAVVIAMLQLKDFFGLHVEHMPEHSVERAIALGSALPTMLWRDTLVGAFTLALLLLIPRVTRKIPAPLIALSLGAVAALVLARLFPGAPIATIGTRFSYQSGGHALPGIPQLPPVPILPWNATGPDSMPLHWNLQLLRELMPSAFAIAMLGAIESLLSAVVSDGMAGTKHNPNSELLGIGVANIVAPFFGGFAATGAIARTATGIRAGARSPLASVMHAFFVLAAVLVLAPLLAYLPMASLAALLLIVAWNMGEVRHFAHVMRVAPRSDVAVLLTCFSLTVVFDMVISVSVGVVLAALLFMRRMAEISGARLFKGEHPQLKIALPRRVIFFEVAGPLFFGAAQKAMSALDVTSGGVRVAILDLANAPVLDMTGLVNLESAVDRLKSHHTLVIFSRLPEQPARVLEKAGLRQEAGVLAFAATVEDAVALAQRHLEGLDRESHTPHPGLRTVPPIAGT